MEGLKEKQPTTCHENELREYCLRPFSGKRKLLEQFSEHSKAEWKVQSSYVPLLPQPHTQPHPLSTRCTKAAHSPQERNLHQLVKECFLHEDVQDTFLQFRNKEAAGFSELRR